MHPSWPSAPSRWAGPLRVGCGRSPGCWPARSRRAPGGLRLPWPANATW